MPARSIDEHVDATASAIAAHTEDLGPFYLDGFQVEEERSLEAGEEPIAGLFAILRDAGSEFIPVIGLDRVREYGEAVREAVGEDGHGACLRLLAADLEDAVELRREVDALLGFLGLTTEAVDLVVDFGPHVPLRYATAHVVNALPHLQDWRALVLASSSFPVDLSGVSRGTVVELPRSEWRAWRSLQAQREQIERVPLYGDYGINHPELVEIDPRLMRMSPNIRYTADAHFVIAKGMALPRKKDKVKSAPPAEQYPALAQEITGHPSWCGADFSWGDGFIAACARGESVGSATTWRQVGTSHHLAFVVQQLASLP